MNLRLLPLLLIAVLVTGCDQVSQELPFDVDLDAPVAKTIGPEGGFISSPQGISIEFSQGSLTSSTQVQIIHQGDATLFPGSVDGEILSETVFQVQPMQALNAPANLNLRVLDRTLTLEEILRVGFATEGPEGPVMVEDVTYDLVSNVVRGPIENLGYVAVRVAEDVLTVGDGTPPTLGGGNFGGETGSTQTSLATVSGSTQRYLVNCGPTGNVPRCLGSDAIKMWASNEVGDRFGTQLVLVGPEIVGDLTFSDFVDGNPTTVNGWIEVSGMMRVKIGQTVASYKIDQSLTTGEGSTASPSSMSVAFNQLTVAVTSEGSNEVMEYEIGRQGTGQQLIVQVEEDIELENEDGSITNGKVIIHLRMRL